MYSLDLNTGIVTLDSDGTVVAPCQSAEEPNFIAYKEWVMAGNEPNIIPQS
jgi:hypothetical protein